MKLTTKFNDASMRAQLAALGKDMEESQEQALVRWSVATARSLAKETAPFGSQPAQSSESAMELFDAMLYDAYKCCVPCDTARKYKAGTIGVSVNGKKFQIKPEVFLDSPDAVIQWIEQNRTLHKKRVRKLRGEGLKYARKNDILKAVKTKFKTWGGLSKDGWIDAGRDAAKAHKGPRPERMGAGFLRWAQKDADVGRSRRSGKRMKSLSDLYNLVSYVGNNIDKGDMTSAARSGLRNAIEFYKYALGIKTKKKKPRK